MSKYDWLLFLHVTGAFGFLGGSVLAAVLNIAAQNRDRPSEIALLMRLVQVAVVAIGIGALLTLVIGLWLVRAADRGYDYFDFWVIAAVVLWLVTNALGSIGGKREKAKRELAERLAREGDAPNAELTALVRDRNATLIYVASGVAGLLILADMIWKPGA